MSQKDDSVYFGHMLDMGRKVAERTQGLTRERFDASEDLRLALAHLVQVIGEAARRVSDEGRRVHPEIPWRQITGMRHKIVHDYMDIKESILWEVVTGDMPLLLAALEKIVLPDNDEQ